METIDQILSQLLFHDISKHEAAERIREIIKQCHPDFMIEMFVDSIASTVHNDHGIVNLEKPYQYSKIKHLKKGDKVLIMKQP